LAVSVVLYHPDCNLLGRMLGTLGHALECADANLARAELFLVDHSSRRQPEAVLEDWSAKIGRRCKVRYDYVGANPGFGAGHNRAFSFCREWATYFLVANPDIEFAPDALAAGLAFFASHPEAGLLAPALIERDGSLRPGCFRYPTLHTLMLRMLGKDHRHRSIFRYECRDWDPNAIQFGPPLVSGCCMFFRAGAFARLGGFDPTYFLYFEDFDLALRARAQGLSYYCPSMRIKHLGP
jgi:GT2 family glycosyltransferase